MVPLDRALVSPYRLVNSNHFAICSGLAAICNASIFAGVAGSFKVISQVI